ncbi:MAG: hypothetical protein JKY56_25165 [Kofleriaceae bacterium]|nr:hypothetical protein [Kofleriaceae bacterium]
MRLIGRLIAPLLVSSLAMHCQSDGGMQNPDETSDAALGEGVDAEPSGTIDAGEPAVRCTEHALPRELDVAFDGEIREVLLAGKADLPSAPIPLIINFHGFTDSPSDQEGYSKMSEHAVANGYVVAYPRGTGLAPSWNGGACCGIASTTNIDDVAFTSAIIDAVAESACIDREKVYAVGYSNGGFLAHRLACELSDKLAGVASVAGVMGIDDCTPSRAIPLLQLHGSSDITVPYGGSLLLGYPSVDQTMEDWAERHACPGQEPEEFFNQGDSTCIRYQGCAAPLARCRVSGGGHTWPGGTAPIIRGSVSSDLDATDMMWQFFQGTL